MIESVRAGKEKRQGLLFLLFFKITPLEGRGTVPSLYIYNGSWNFKRVNGGGRGEDGIIYRLESSPVTSLTHLLRRPLSTCTHDFMSNNICSKLFKMGQHNLNYVSLP